MFIYSECQFNFEFWCEVAYNLLDRKTCAEIFGALWWGIVGNCVTLKPRMIDSARKTALCIRKCLTLFIGADNFNYL